jgi:isopentenyl diphosphate isomerase/L-lactate dehydrogenase-like FMN-dependent dehydrogenase
MTNQQYGDCQFESYFDSVKGRTPGCGSALECKDLAWSRYLTTLPILLNGIQHSDDARRAKDCGVEAICCPNHDGRLADGGLPALKGGPPDVEDADGTAVLFDSRVHGRFDAAKALAAEGYCRAGLHPLEPT